MPRIFDNIETSLLPALEETLRLSCRADFCVGYFNLRGWKALDAGIEPWIGGAGHCCRLLVGMQRLSQDELRALLSVTPEPEGLDNSTALCLRKKLAEEFRAQLIIGVPTNADEAGLRRLAGQLRAGKLVVKLFLRHPLHAKLYLLFRNDPINPVVGYLGSSNLTLAGLSRQGELNVDVLDHDASAKLARWFEDRWKDRWCVDIIAQLIEVIDQSWARETPLSPYHIYIKMAYHLAQEARAGLAEFRIPPEFDQKLFELLPGTPAQNGPVQDRRTEFGGSIRPVFRARYRGRHQRAQTAALRAGQLPPSAPTPVAHQRRSRPVGWVVPRGEAADGLFAGLICSSAWKAAARRSSNPSSATSCATTSSCTRWNTAWTCRSAFRMLVCWMPAPTMATRTMSTPAPNGWSRTMATSHRRRRPTFAPRPTSSNGWQRCIRNGAKTKSLPSY